MNNGTPGQSEHRERGTGVIANRGTASERTTFTLASGAASVSDTGVTANSVIRIIGIKTFSGTVGAWPYVTSRTPTTGFVVAGGGSDNSTYIYERIEQTNP